VRIHRLRLTNFRGTPEVEVAFAERGVTIVEGPNEVGKSSLAEAIDLVLSARDSSASQRVRSVQPVGSDVGTAVTIEVSSGPYRFVLTKQWNKGRRTELEVLAPEHEHLVGRDAHDRVEAILAETLDATLWSALRLAQGAAPGPVPFGEVLALGRVLDAAAGADQLTDVESDLWERVVEERDRYWTATGQPRVERVAVSRRVEEARSRVGEAEAQLRELADATAEVARLADEAAQLDRTRRDLDQQQRALADRVAEVAARRGELRLIDAEVEATRSRREVAAAAHARRRAAVEELEARRAASAAAERELSRLEPDLAVRRRRHDELRDRLDAARHELEAARRARDLAVADRDHRRREIEVGQLAERRDRVQEAERQLAEAEAVLAGAAVDDDLVARIESAEIELAAARAAATAAGAVVRLVARRALDAQVDGAALHLDAGQQREVVVGNAFVLDLHDAVRVELEPGLDARTLADAVTVAEAELRKLCAEAGVADRTEARGVAARRREALARRDAARDAIAANLRDLTLEVISSKVRGLGRRIEEHLAERPADPPLPADFESAKVAAEAAEQALVVAREEAAAAEARAEGIDADLLAAERELAAVAARRQQAVDAVDAAVEALASERAEVSDDQLDAALARAEQAVETALAARANAARELAAADPDLLDAQLANARAAAARAADRWSEVRERRGELQAFLDVRGELGLQEQLDAAATELEHLQRQQARTEARARAALVLHTAMAEARAQARQRYVTPFRHRIEQLGRIVFGPTFGVALDDDLGIATRTLDGITLPVDQLSAGAREQLGVIARLACAGIVSVDEGAPVIFDDTLGWSDPERLDTMGATIGVAGRDCQVIVLTCSPDRYASVGGATVVRLGTADRPVPATPPEAT